MKALSLWQPWASLMARGYKTIETRHWRTGYRGLVAILAAKRKQLADELEALKDIQSYVESRNGEFPGGASRWGYFASRPDALPRGCIVAIGDLFDCRLINHLASASMSPLEFACGNYEPGRYGWMFRDIVTLPAPIPLRGRQGLFDLPADIARQCELVHGREHRKTPA